MPTLSDRDSSATVCYDEDTGQDVFMNITGADDDVEANYYEDPRYDVGEDSSDSEIYIYAADLCKTHSEEDVLKDYANFQEVKQKLLEKRKIRRFSRTHVQARAGKRRGNGIGFRQIG